MQRARPKATDQQRTRSQRGRGVAGAPHSTAFLRRPWLLGALALLAIAALAIGAIRGQPAAGDATAAPEAGRPAPAIALATPDGEPVRLSDLRGQVVLVNFWATWCPPCRAEMPAIQAAYERYHDQGFAVLAVTADADPAAVRGFLRENGLTFPALIDPNGATHNAYLANGLPSSFFIDRQGVVRAVYRGPINAAVIDRQLASLLAAP